MVCYIGYLDYEPGHGNADPDSLPQVSDARSRFGYGPPLRVSKAVADQLSLLVVAPSGHCASTVLPGNALSLLEREEAHDAQDLNEPFQPLDRKCVRPIETGTVAGQTYWLTVSRLRSRCDGREVAAPAPPPRIRGFAPAPLNSCSRWPWPAVLQGFSFDDAAPSATTET